MEKLIQTKGGKAFFRELNMARIPFFFIAAIEKTRKIERNISVKPSHRERWVSALQRIKLQII